jgi:DNA-binding SARP family transcriptional activator
VHWGADESWGRQITAAREREGLTQRELAARTGLSVRTIRDIERGRVSRPRPGSRRQLMDALHLRPMETEPAGAGHADVAPVRVAIPGTGPVDDGGRRRTPPIARPRWVIGALGPIALTGAGPTMGIRSPATRIVTAVLALRLGHAIPVRDLVDLLWTDPPQTCRDLVQGHVAAVRRLLRAAGADPAGLRRVGDGYLLEPEPWISDIAAFEALSARARTAARDGRIVDAVDGYRSALACWRGPAAADCPPPVRLHPDVVAADLRRTEAATDLADVSLAAGRCGDVVSALRAVHAQDPLNEALAARLIRVLSGAGEQGTALALFDSVRRRLDDELGVRPGPELAAAHLAVLRADPPSVGTRDPAGRTAAIPTSSAAHVVHLAAPSRPAQLPGGTPHFAGRRDAIHVLDRIAALQPDQDLLDGPPARTSPALAVITGQPGVGKTALALHWAHRAAARYPDGQLYANLRGFHPDGVALHPAAALGAFVSALGTAPGALPADTDVLAAHFRGLVAGRRILIVLDNARDAEQVRPLLPGSPSCLVLITSRNRLLGLVADGAEPVPIGPLSDEESRELLALRLGRSRMERERQPIRELVSMAAGLPLALGIVAANAAARPARPMAAMVPQVRADATGGLAALADGDPGTDPRAVFSWSYRALSAGAAALFRQLSLHPGPELNLAAATSLAGRSAARALDELCHAHLLLEPSPGRLALHDLLHAYARRMAQQEDPAVERLAATRRLLEHYLHTTRKARQLVDPHRRLGDVAAPERGVVPEALPDRAAALAWLDRERPVLLAAVRLADRTPGMGRHTRLLAEAMAYDVDHRGCWHDLRASGTAAVGAAAPAGERGPEAGRAVRPTRPVQRRNGRRGPVPATDPRRRGPPVPGHLTATGTKRSIRQRPITPGSTRREQAHHATRPIR